MDSALNKLLDFLNPAELAVLLKLLQQCFFPSIQKPEKSAVEHAAVFRRNIQQTFGNLTKIFDPADRQVLKCLRICG